MNVLAAGILFLTLGFAASLPTTSKIVGGEETTIEEIPYQLALEQGLLGILWSFACGAVIIGPNSVLTAGHCVEGSNANSIRVRSGSTRHSDGEIHTAVRLTLHPDYVVTDGISDNDIAFFTVTPPFDFGDTAQPINITTVEPVEGDTATISGWGVTSDDSSSPPAVLRKVSIPIVSRDSCSDSYSDVGTISDKMICAGLSEGGKDSCSGDSGGPLVVNGILSGLVSWGLGCAEPGYPGVYTNVAPFAPWIAEQLALAKKELDSA